MNKGWSPEELELAGEELGLSLDTLKRAGSAALRFVKTPTGAAITSATAAAVLSPVTLAAIQAARASAKKNAQAKQARKPAPGMTPARAPARAPAPDAQISAPSAAAPAPAPAPAPSNGFSLFSFKPTPGTEMGAEPPMTEKEVAALIAREGNPFKRMRMADTFNRRRR